MKYDVLIIDKASNTVHGVAVYNGSLEEAERISHFVVSEIMPEFHTIVTDAGRFHKGDKLPTEGIQ